MILCAKENGSSTSSTQKQNANISNTEIEGSLVKSSVDIGNYYLVKKITVSGTKEESKTLPIDLNTFLDSLFPLNSETSVCIGILI